MKATFVQRMDTIADNSTGGEIGRMEVILVDKSLLHMNTTHTHRRTRT